MKYNFLGFPSKYEVGKQIRDKFIKSSNLTPARRRIIEERVTEIEIMYDLHFQDSSELVVIIAGIDMAVDEWTESNVATAIASSFPYYSMVVVRNGRAAKFFTFESKQQERNIKRMSIEKVHRSFSINIENPDEKTKQLIQIFASYIDENSSARIVSEKWSASIEQAWEQYKIEKKWKQFDMGEMRKELIEDEIRFHSVDYFLDELEEKRDHEYSRINWWESEEE